MLVVKGTPGADTIRVVPDGNSGGVKVLIGGAGLGSFAPTGRIVVLGGADADDLQIAGSIARATELYGGAGNDRLKAGGGPAILSGGAGDDQLIGGRGRNLLIGGLGADRLVGGPGDDILIGGTTRYDSDAGALSAILAEWSRTDLKFAERVSNLSRGLAGGIRLDATTVADDGSTDKLTGSAGSDWLLAGAGDQVTLEHPMKPAVCYTPTPKPPPGPVGKH
jgi:Ca2+-binding RTX toxin-like protein